LKLKLKVLEMSQLTGRTNSPNERNI